MATHQATPIFSLGLTIITSNAQETLHPEDVLQALRRHAGGDWGECGAEDAQSNVEALRENHRLLSAYRDRTGARFWIITEWDRSITTILLPKDY